MQMIDRLAAEIAQETPVGDDEQEYLKAVLTITRRGVEAIGIYISPEKWLGLGVHMLAMIRRLQQGQSLPVIEPGIADQLSPDSRRLSMQVLTEVAAIIGGRVESSEEILLAIHFEAARESGEADTHQGKESVYGN